MSKRTVKKAQRFWGNRQSCEWTLSAGELLSAFLFRGTVLLPSSLRCTACCRDDLPLWLRLWSITLWPCRRSPKRSLTAQRGVHWHTITAKSHCLSSPWQGSGMEHRGVGVCTGEYACAREHKRIRVCTWAQELFTLWIVWILSDCIVQWKWHDKLKWNCLRS